MTLSVLKSDNANGLFGFREPCTPVRVASESATVVCNVLRQRGDDGTVTVTWLIQQRTAQGLSSAAADFNSSTGSLVFLRGERLKVGGLSGVSALGETEGGWAVWCFYLGRD